MGLYLYQGGEMKKIAGYLDKNSYATKTELPSKVSDLTNDMGYINPTDLDNYYTKDDVYSKAEIDSLISGL